VTLAVEIFNESHGWEKRPGVLAREVLVLPDMGCDDASPS